MITVKAFLQFLIVAFIIINGCRSDKQLSRETKDTLNSASKNYVIMIGDTIAVSPDKRDVLLVSNGKDSLELWITNSGRSYREKILKLNKDESIMSVKWSPSRKLIAFVSFNTEGHSPLTTTHVWVVQNNGTGLKRVFQPHPDERFDTFDPVWKNDDSLFVKGISLDGEIKQIYIYDYSTNQIKKSEPN